MAESQVARAAPVAPPPFGRLPPALQSVLSALPEESWHRIRVLLIRSQEEGDLVDLCPDLYRVMTLCPPRLVTRARAGEIRFEEFDLGYARLHEAIHGVREALSCLLDLAGLGPPGLRPAASGSGAPAATPGAGS